MSARRFASTLAVLALGASPAAVRAVPANGDLVVVTGVVADRAGAPIADLEVVLEASRLRFDVRTLRREKVETRTASARSNQRGEFSLEWPWADGFELFELKAGVRLRGAGGEQLVELARNDIGRRMRHGGPVVATLEVADTGLLASLRQFLAGLRTADEQRMYQDLGRPESIDVVEGPGWTEVTWWYFRQGRACRFRDGRLLEVREFDPVQGF